MAEQLTPIPPPAELTAASAATCVSFGDNGTTASVTAMGQLMQITSFLGAGRSGFFCVDGPKTSAPRFVMERAHDLMDLSTHKGPIGLKLLRSENEISDEMRRLSDKSPKLEFIRDRWPRYTAANDHLESERQYFSHENIAYDVWKWRKKGGSMWDQTVEGMYFDAGLLIRELDFVNSRHGFNEEPSNNTHYKIYRGIPGLPENSIILAHAGTMWGEEHKVVGLVVSFYVNGKPGNIQKTNDTSRARSFRIKLDESIPENQCRREFEVVTAYRLELLRPDFCKTLPKFAVPRHCSLEEILLEPYFPLRFSSHELFNFILRRTLEHILSVCSIPVTSAQGVDKKPIALTCGDLSGHRVVNIASFFAFQFLLSVWQFLKTLKSTDLSLDEGEFCEHLKERIRRTCEAHLDWLFVKADKPRDCFITNYWADGKEIKSARSNEDQVANPVDSADSDKALSVESLMNTPLQIIKLADFTALIRGEEHPKPPRALGFLSERLIPSWIKMLSEADKRGFTAFPRPGTQEYHLRDHVWIWRALVSLEKLGYGDLLRTNGASAESDLGQCEEAPSEPGQRNKYETARDYSSATVQSNVLKRFTTENPTSKRRMIAVSRTSAETRFMIHSRDTTLLYPENYRFFGKATSLWEMTMEVQKFHRDNEDSFWDNPLRYAVALMMGEKGFQINTRTPEDMIREAKKVLSQGMSANGLFPGNINGDTKEPELFLDASWRDFHWHVVFEVPFILWTLYQSTRPTLDSRPREVEAKSSTGDARLSASKKKGNITREEESTLDRASPEMKKVLPSNRLIDHQSITELPDEWLYPYPDFLDFEPKIECRFQASEKLGSCGLETGDVITTAAQLFKDRREKGREKFKDAESLRGIFVDVPKAAHSWEYYMNANACHNPEDDAEPCNNKQLQEKLDSLRKVQCSKKRLLWMPNTDHDTALLCFLGSPTSQRICLASFFDKHERRDEYFFDETTATLNLWKTELHVSWYRLVEQCHRQDCEEISFLGSESKLERAAMGFLFIGDFFDRYWTCFVLEYDPKERGANSPLFKPHTEPNSCSGGKEPHTPSKSLQLRFMELIKPTDVLPETDCDKRPWRQRKVLELLLFDSILRKSLEHSKEILDEVIAHLLSLLSPNTQKDLGHRLSTLNVLFSSQMTSRAYMAFSKKWPPIQYTLQVLEDDLRNTLDMTKLWGNREEDRGPEKPRWTKDDERKYRSSITKLSISNHQKVRALQQQLTDIRSMRTSLTNGLESSRNELSFRSASVLVIFTLITFIYLPFGLAAAFLSMSAVPQPSVRTVWYIMGSSLFCGTYGAFFIASRGVSSKFVTALTTRRKESQITKLYMKGPRKQQGDPDTVPEHHNRQVWRSVWRKVNYPRNRKHQANDEEEGPSITTNASRSETGSRVFSGDVGTATGARC